MPKDWDKVQEPIKQFYLKEDRLLADVKERLEKDHDFVCSTRALQMKLKEWNYCKYRTSENKETFRGKRKQSSATSQEQNRPEHRSRTSLPSETIDLCTHPPPTTCDANCNGSRSELFSAYTPSANGEEDQISTELTLLMLHEAVKLNDTTSIDKLLEAGADIHAYDDGGFQALHYAVSAHWDARDERIACILATQLLFFGADAATGTRDHCRSSMHLALWSTKLLKILLQHQVDPNVKDLAGDTPLHMAISEQKTPESNTCGSIEMLLEAGADPNLKNNRGETPFHMALKAFRVHPLDIPLVAFIEKGAKVNVEVPEIGLPFQALAGYFRAKFDCSSGYPLVRESLITEIWETWETALHTLLLRTSTLAQGGASTLICSRELAFICLAKIASSAYPAESMSTLTITLCQHITTESERGDGADLLILPDPILSLCARPYHPFAECLSILLAWNLHGAMAHAFEIPTDRLDRYLYILLKKAPGPTDSDAVLGLLSTMVNPLCETLLAVCGRWPSWIYLATEGLSCSSERRRVVQILLLGEWISQWTLSLYVTTPVTAFWKAFRERFQTRTWVPPNSPQSIPGDIYSGTSGEDRRALWEIMVRSMADRCLEDCDFMRTKMILRDVRRMGIELKPEWMGLLLDRC